MYLSPPIFFFKKIWIIHKLFYNILQNNRKVQKKHSYHSFNIRLSYKQIIRWRHLHYPPMRCYGFDFKFLNQSKCRILNFPITVCWVYIYTKKGRNLGLSLTQLFYHFCSNRKKNQRRVDCRSVEPSSIRGMLDENSKFSGGQRGADAKTSLSLVIIRYSASPPLVCYASGADFLGWGRHFSCTLWVLVYLEIFLPLLKFESAPWNPGYSSE